MPSEVNESAAAAASLSADSDNSNKNVDDVIIDITQSDDEDEDVYDAPIEGKPICSGDMDVDAEQMMLYHRYVYYLYVMQ